MKIIFTAKGENWDSKMDPRFGRTKFFVVYNEESKELSSINNSDVEQDAHGAGPKAAQKIAETKAQVLITGNGPGGNAASVLERIGIKCYIGAGDMTVKEAYEAYKNNALKLF
ncbi:MAG: dinitrogenase iron-molybdenum cofactor biosynthesis protein [Bacteroidetes bacterium 4572_77]|nr:MAG: dinitrogenase iron-molybdenum cofactor biosynthesis protein [Bacteroidetes bacterium 4572_77]